jgi:hypothetical protein
MFKTFINKTKVSEEEFLKELLHADLNTEKLNKIYSTDD